MVGMEEFEVPNRRKVQITQRALEIDDHDDCPFCLGRAAAHRGEGEDGNPYPKPDARKGSVDLYETDYGVWLAGYGIGSNEPGGVPLYLRKDSED